MEDHLKYTCPQRRTRCEFCNKEFTGHSLEVGTDIFYNIEGFGGLSRQLYIGIVSKYGAINN